MSNEGINPFERVSYIALTLDPVHVGTGEFRLGRVDNAIVREAGTNLPKIPGSSLAGVARAYTAMSASPQKYLYAKNGSAVSCAGKGGEDGTEHCGGKDCPVCIGFGFSKKKESFQGLVQFSDLRILFYPIRSCLGPVWITSPLALTDAGVSGHDDKGWKTWFQESGGNSETAVSVAATAAGVRLNFGWLYMKLAAKSASLGILLGAATKNLPQLGLSELDGRIHVVPDELFPLLVEDHLEVRTSVSISPKTGAAAEGALFTFEAIPRATVLYWHATYLNPELFRLPGGGETEFTLSGAKALRPHVERGLEYTEYLGIGGSNTRGMGRMRIVKA